MVIKIELASNADLSFIQRVDSELTPEQAKRKIDLEEVIIARDANTAVGWLRWSYFWDEIPFINQLSVLETHQGKGIGSQLVSVWEASMRTVGHRKVMTSSQANDEVQAFFRKIGYQDRGALTLPAEPLKILFLKELY